MSKKTQRLITTALTTTLAVGSITIPAMATQSENINELYTAAFEATIKTQDLDKVTQNDINEARKAIDALRGTSVKSAVPTFSSIVDKAQQKFLTKSYNSIVKCQKTLDQKDINQARENIKDLPPEFKNAYSMAIDEAQQKKVDAVYEAIQKAEKSQKQEDIKIAQDLIDNLKTVVDNDAVKEWAEKNEATFKDKTQKLIIIGAIALNDNSVEVVFNKPLDPKCITADNFSVTPKGESYNNLYVGTAKLSEDGTSVTLNVLDKFKNKCDYVVNASNIKDSKGNDLTNNKTIGFNYESAEVKSIGFTTTNIPISANLRDYIVVKDALGRDVTDQYKNKVTFTSTNTNIVSKDGQVAKKIEAYVEGKPSNTISYDKNNNIINNTVMVDAKIEGKNISTSSVITVTKSMPTDFEGYKIVKNYSEVKDKTFSEISKDDEVDSLLVDKKAELVLGFKDQFGKEMKLNDYTCVVEENYNPEVAIISDGNNGELTVNALSAGKAYAKVKCGAIEKVICINVKGASLPKEISTKVDDVNLVLENEAGVSFDYVVNNNYGEKFTGNNEVVYETKSKDDKNNNQAIEYTLEDSEGKTITKGFNVSIDEANNKITIKPESTKENPLKTGVYKLILTKKYEYKGQETKLTKTIDVNVVKGGSLNSYKVKVSNINLDRNSKDTKKNTSTISVYKVDDNGNEIGLASDVSLEILKDGKKTDKLTDTKENGTFVLSSTENGTYTVNVKVGTYVAKQLTITVSDTTPVPTTVVLNSQLVNVNDNSTIGDLLKELNYSVKDQFGKDFKDKELKGITYSVANEKGVSIDGTNSLKDVIKLVENKNNEHSFDLVISNLKMSNDKTFYFDKTVLVKVTVK